MPDYEPQPRTILQDPDPRLREIARPITPAQMRSDEMQHLIDDMFATVKANNLIGMAAPQIGELVRLFVIDFTQDDGVRHGPIVVANPQLTHLEGEITYPEGSPCRPGGEWSVTRSARLRCRGLNRAGTPFTLKAQGLLSICVQHEVDHLNGVMCFDKNTDHD